MVAEKNKAKYLYSYCCVNPMCEEELFHIYDNNEDVTYDIFIKHVDRDEFNDLCRCLGYNKDFRIKNDWHVSYHKSDYNGETIYFYAIQQLNMFLKGKQVDLSYSFTSEEETLASNV